MSYAETRRRLCVAILGTGLLAKGPTLSAEKKVRPFCRFSLHDGWSNEGPAEYITHRAGPSDKSGVPQVVSQIKRVLSISANFDVLIAEQEDNAFATVANGRKILVVDVGFLQKLNRLARTEWAAIQVIAHEVGHHIAGFSSDSHRSELNADYWSGQVLQRLGAAQTAATSSIRSVGTEVDTPSHPNKHRRARTIARGWEDAAAGRIDYSFCDGCQ